jgi:20S proteasome subunit beta 6
MQLAQPSSSAHGPTQAATWSPYDNNGGTCVAIAGADYCVVAADTRMSTGFNILTRNSSKVCKLSDKCLMASAGFKADAKTLQKTLLTRQVMYQHNHNKVMSCPAMAQLLSNTLYYKRFFPYYTFNLLGGLDTEGKGCVYTYDAIGSYERTGYSCQGSGQALIMPVLDNQLKTVSPLVLPLTSGATPLSQSEAVDLVKDCFATAGERDIFTGDSVEIYVINASGVHLEILDLKLD